MVLCGGEELFRHNQSLVQKDSFINLSSSGRRSDAGTRRRCCRPLPPPMVIVGLGVGTQSRIYPRGGRAIVCGVCVEFAFQNCTNFYHRHCCVNSRTRGTKRQICFEKGRRIGIISGFETSILQVYCVSFFWHKATQESLIKTFKTSKLNLVTNSIKYFYFEISF